mmetsp:Transcript_104631/g.326335  ORF Transcript_104631/g.326335 Transcript_104631/m.326335 type:complete len:306 (-) Transcript_104631:322-1239(-)
MRALAQRGHSPAASQEAALQGLARVRMVRDGPVGGAQRHAQGLPAAGVPVSRAGARAQDLAAVGLRHVDHDAAVVRRRARAAGAPDGAEGHGLGRARRTRTEDSEGAAGAGDYPHSGERRVRREELVHGLAVVQLRLQDPAAAVHDVLEHVDAHAAFLEHVLRHQRHGRVHDGRHGDVLGLAGLDEDPLVLELEVLALRRQRGHGRQAAVQAPELEPIRWRQQRAPEASHGRGLQAAEPAGERADEGGDGDDHQDGEDGVEPRARVDRQWHAVDARGQHNVPQVRQHVLLEGPCAVVRLPHEPRH